MPVRPSTTTEERSLRASAAAKAREARKRAGLPSLREERAKEPLRKCKCGCGKPVLRPEARFLPSHHFKVARRHAEGKVIDPEGQWLALPVLLRCAKCGWTKAQVPGNLAANTYRTHSCTNPSGSDTGPAGA